MARTSTRTHCPYCSLQCGVVVTAGDRPAELVPDVATEANLGGLCSKGWTAAEARRFRAGAEYFEQISQMRLRTRFFNPGCRDG